MGKKKYDNIDLSNLRSQLEEAQQCLQRVTECISGNEHIYLSKNQESRINSCKNCNLSDAELAEFAKKIILTRQDQREVFKDLGAFNDPAWDILLDLFVSGVGGRIVSVTDATLAASVPTTTALRWVWYLEKADLIVRSRDRNDGRRIFVSLSDLGLSSMRRTISAIFSRLSSPNLQR